MISISMMKGRFSLAVNILLKTTGVNYDRISLSTTTAQTITVTHKDGTVVNYPIGNNSGIAVNRTTAGGAGTVNYFIPNKDAITFFLVWFPQEFPDLSALINISSVTISGGGSNFYAANLMALQSRLITLGISDGWNFSNNSIETFILGMQKLKNLSFGYSYAGYDRTKYSFINNLTSLETLTMAGVNGGLIPNLQGCVSLKTINFDDFDGYLTYLGGCLGECVDYLPNTTILKTISFNQCNMTNANVNLFIDKIYAWANLNSNNNVTLNIGGNNAAASGTYDGTTDWSGGLPTSPKAKLWHLVNSRVWTITFTA